MNRDPRSAQALSFGALSLLMAALLPFACTLAENGARTATGTSGTGATATGTGGSGGSGGTGTGGDAGGAVCMPTGFDDCATPGVDEDCDGDAPECTGGPLDVEAVGSPGTGMKSEDFETGFAVATSGSKHVVAGVKNANASTYDVTSGELFVVQYKDDLSVDWKNSYLASGGHAVARGVSLDAMGNIVVVGEFAGTLDIAGTMLQGDGIDVFVAKFKPDGALLWAHDYGDGSDQQAFAVAVNAAGDIFVTGQFEGDIDFGSGMLTSKGIDAFVAKLDAEGAGKWAENFAGDDADQMGWSIATTTDDNVVVAGSFYGALDFGGGPIASKGSEDVFVVKLQRDTGDRIWSKSFGDADFQRAYSVSVGAGGDIAVAGEFLGEIDAGKQIASNPDSTDAFVFTLASVDGAPRWARRLGDGGDEAAQSVAMDGAGNVLVSGHFEASFLIGKTTFQTKGATDIYVAKLGAKDGEPLWGRSFGGGGNDRGWAVAADPEGNALVTGSFSQTVDFGAPAGSVQSTGANDLFLLELAP